MAAKHLWFYNKNNSTLLMELMWIITIEAHSQSEFLLLQTQSPCLIWLLGTDIFHTAHLKQIAELKTMITHISSNCFANNYCKLRVLKYRGLFNTRNCVSRRGGQIIL